MCALRLVVLLVIAAVARASFPAEMPADEPAKPQGSLKKLLEHRVLEEDQAEAEVKQYCDRRIAILSRPESLSSWQHDAEQIGRSVLDDVVFRGVPEAWRAPSRRVEWLRTMDGGPGYRIKKLRYEALPGLWIPALLYEPEQLEGRVPAVLNVNGHEREGKAAPYKQIRCINLAKRGMLALNVEWLGMGQLRSDGFSHARMNQLDLCGTSGLAVFYLAMERGLDVLLEHPHADADRIAMAGLSGGGWQTILLSSLDPRVALANPVAGYSSFKTRIGFISDLGDSEQTPTDLAKLADYTHLTALRAPRPTLLTYNSKDECCFAASHALEPLVDAASPVFELAGATGRLRTHVNDDPGTHNFERENREAFYKMVGDHFFAGDGSFDASEIDSQSEVKSAEELIVPMPGENLDFHKLALQLAAELPRHRRQGAVDIASRGASPRPSSTSVAEIARLVDYQPTAEKVGESSVEETTARYWRVKLGDDWTVPLVELFRDASEHTSCVIADGGRSEAADEIESLLAANHRVLAIDPFYIGESKPEDRGYLLALLVSSVGARPIGVQADQVQAVTRWAAKEFDQPVQQHVAVGPRVALAALIAAATGEKDECPRRLVLHDSLGSLAEIIANNWSVEDYAELFCFGLLEHCDIDDLVELAQPCGVIRK